MKGKTEPVLIYGLRGDAKEKSTPNFQALEEKHEAMITAYRGQQWGEASALISSCRELALQTSGESKRARWIGRALRSLRGADRRI